MRNPTGISNSELSLAENRENIAFIHLLRGAAPLIIMWSHLVAWWLFANKMDWVVRDFVEDTIIRPLHLYQAGGHLGVVLFFLISGFIVTHVSLRESRFQFVVRRVFRIAPMLAVALLMVLLSSRLLRGSSLPTPVLGLDPAVTPWDYIKSAFLINWPMGSGRVVLSVSWTLFVEVVFYILTACFIQTSRARPISITWTMIAISTVTILPIYRFPETKLLAGLLCYVNILLVGRALYFLSSGIANRVQSVMVGAGATLAFLGMYVALWPSMLTEGGTPPIFTYAISILIFVALMTANLRSTPRVFSFFADISYSLYMVHIPMGCLALGLGYSVGAPLAVCFLVAFVFVVCVATLTHLFIEVPFRSLGRYVGRWMRESSPVAAYRDDPPGRRNA